MLHRLWRIHRVTSSAPLCILPALAVDVCPIVRGPRRLQPLRASGAAAPVHVLLPLQRLLLLQDLLAHAARTHTTAA